MASWRLNSEAVSGGRRARSEQEGASETWCRNQRAGGNPLLNLVVSLSEMGARAGF